MEQQAQRIRLKLPDQDLQFLTIGSDQPKKLKAWVEELPLMNMGETSRQLYQFIQELNRLQIDARQRFQLLETVRPTILHVCDALGQHYLNQSVVLPEKARRVASLAQALQGHLANGYKLVAVRGMRKLKDKDARTTVVISIHRAVTALTDTLVRCYQLYFPTPRNLWLELHQLYLLAEANGLEATEVADPDFKAIETCTIADAYARVLLLATAKPNQLRQQELAALYRATEEWSDLIAIKPAGEKSDLFVFDLQQDRPPTYRTHVSVAGAQSRYIDSAALVERLSQVAAGQPPSGFSVPKGITDSLVNHLQQAWGALTERSFKRISETGSIHICLGLGALHYYTSGCVSFESQVGSGQMKVLADNEDNPFLSGKAGKPGPRPQSRILEEDDPWSHAADSGKRRMAEDATTEDIDFSRITSALQDSGRESKVHFDHYTCKKVNVSPGGYCLEWAGEAPSQLRTGELMGLREPGFDEWAVGVVRWVKQLPNQGVQFGVELLAPRAIPAGARVLKKTGDATDFMRVLLLPALHAIGQPATLLAPNVGFRTGFKLELVEQGRASRVVLQRKVNSTASFGQYEFQEPRVGGEDASSGKGGAEDFDSIWSSL